MALGSSPQVETHALPAASEDAAVSELDQSNPPPKRRVSLVVDFSVFSKDNEGNDERESEDVADAEPRRMTENPMAMAGQIKQLQSSNSLKSTALTEEDGSSTDVVSTEVDVDSVSPVDGPAEGAFHTSRLISGDSAELLPDKKAMLDEKLASGQISAEEHAQMLDVMARDPQRPLSSWEVLSGNRPRVDLGKLPDPQLGYVEEGQRYVMIASRFCISTIPALIPA